MNFAFEHGKRSLGFWGQKQPAFELCDKLLWTWAIVAFELSNKSVLGLVSKFAFGHNGKVAFGF